MRTGSPGLRGRQKLQPPPRGLPALPTDGMCAVWDYVTPLAPPESLRFRVWVSLMVGPFFFFFFFSFSSSYLFIHSFQYTTRFTTAMETFAAAKLGTGDDQCQAHREGRPAGASGYVAGPCGFLVFSSAPKSGISLQKKKKKKKSRPTRA